jgi:predicted ATPase/DNA-binding SARP family transcriptional activator
MRRTSGVSRKRLYACQKSNLTNAEEASVGETIEGIPALSIQLFGRMEVLLHGHPVKAPRKSRWLLAILALNAGRPIHRSSLLDQLWQDNNSKDPGHYLRRTLLELRNALEDEKWRVTNPTSDTLAIDMKGVNFDVAAFDLAVISDVPADWARAISLYSGALLPECSDLWIDGGRQARLESYHSMVERLVAYFMSSGNHKGAQDCLRKAIAVDPEWEWVRRELMKALKKTGEYKAALEVYRDLLRFLARDPKAQPEDVTRAEYEEIKAKAHESARPVVNKPENVLGPLHNLPNYLSALIGRRDEVQSAEAMLRRKRLVTLVGTGGVGKTRLAVQVATSMRDEFLGGTWFVDLSPLQDAHMIARSIVAAVGLREEGRRDMGETLAEFLSRRPTLLVLDNCEHVINGCAQLTRYLLAECPSLRVLATSRQPLSVSGENIWRVPSLSFIKPEALSTKPAEAMEQLKSSDAARLFVERAVEANQTFELTESNASVLAGLCARLDGIPLVIELTAAQTRYLTVHEIALRLEKRLPKFTNNSTAPKRHRTLQATMEWGYDLLTDGERLLLQQLALFTGGWSLESAEAICVVEGGDVLELLTSLIDKSFVVAEPMNNKMRFRLLEVVRQFAYNALTQNGALEMVQRRYLEYFTALADEAAPHLLTGQQEPWLQSLEADKDNLRSALHHCLNSEDDAENGLRIAASLRVFWFLQGHYQEGVEVLRIMLQKQGDTSSSILQALALQGAGALAYFRGDLVLSQQFTETALALARQQNQPLLIAACLCGLGPLAHFRGDMQTAIELTSEALKLGAQENDVWITSVALSNQGLIEFYQENLPEAQKRCEQSLELARKSGEKWCTFNALLHLGLVALAQIKISDASRLLAEAYNLSKDLRNSVGMALCGLGLALVRGAQGELEEAVQLFSAATASLFASKVEVPPASRVYFEEGLKLLRQTMTDDHFSRLWESGRVLPLDTIAMWNIHN